MATNEHTNSVPNDRNGRPCPIATGLADLAGSPESVDEARALDNYWLSHRLAQELDELRERVEQMHSSLELALRTAVASGDLQLEALMTMAKDYAFNTANKMFDVHGHVLVAAERLAALDEAKH